MYISPLRIDENYPSLVHYVCSKTGDKVGRVYRTSDGRWYLSTKYVENWGPLEVFAKYQGFLFLNELHKRHHEILKQYRRP